MKQIVQNYKSGELAVIDVPVPTCKAGGVLVRSRFSLISTGTELMKVSEAGKSLAGKARARPDQVAKVMQSVAANGPVATYRKVINRLDSYTPLGYSLCGEVVEVGTGVSDVVVGDLVACAGNEHALHAELNWVPRNLYSRVPAGVDPRHAAFGTVGAIAMQGVRRGEPQLGEFALVIGLGLIGQLVVQLLVASGVRVIGVDLDPARCALAEQLGALVCSDPASGVVDTAASELSGGFGVDQVYLAAGGSSNDPVELAARLSRDRGRVVDIGKCRLDLPWNAYYEKELDVRFSRSYGPGRYDPEYELAGRDYPIGYVRWTERRNLECFLDLLLRRRINVEPLVSHVADFESAEQTYQRLQSGDLKAVAVLFRYPDEPTDGPEPVVLPEQGNGQPMLGAAAPSHLPRPAGPRIGRPGDRLRVAFVGAGNYASSMLLPHLVEHAGVTLANVVTTSSLSASNAQRKFGFGAASTDLDGMLSDPAIDAVFVVTRHASHAALTSAALRAGKAVFVEKPLALDEAQLAGVLSAVEESGNDRLLVGFNRRYAPLLHAARERFGRRIGPATVRYLINAGSLEHGSWYGRSATEGSRFVGEGGHFVDVVSWLLGSEPESVHAVATPGHGDLQVSVRYADGSTAVITYAESGAPGFPKETLDLLADGKVLRLDDFSKVSVVRGRSTWSTPRIPRGKDKGQAAQLDAFLDAVRTGGPMPISIPSLAATTRVTFAVNASLAAGAPVPVQAVADAGSEPASSAVGSGDNGAAS